MLEKIIMNKIKFLALNVSLILVAMSYSYNLYAANESEYIAGMHIVDCIKMGLGIITILGALGFFITTSPKRAHWPARSRRIFFGLFVFCNIISQLFFNVLNVPSNKKWVCVLGKCIKINDISRSKEAI